MNAAMMNSFWDNEEALFLSALFFSVLIHLGFFLAGSINVNFLPSHQTVEIDLTHAARIGGLKSRPSQAAAAPAAPSKPTDWVVSKKKVLMPLEMPKTVEAEKPEPVSPQQVDGSAGSGGGSPFGTAEGDGFMDVTHVSRYPQLLNLTELQANLRKFYPEYERMRRNEGRVTLELHIAADGHISSVNVVRSAGEAFDAAAQKVAMLLRFRPAMVGRESVAVKLRQTIEFKLEE
jgi:TonB family protein